MARQRNVCRAFLLLTRITVQFTRKLLLPASPPPSEFLSCLRAEVGARVAPCRLWLIRVGLPCRKLLPVFPQLRTSRIGTTTSEKCQEPAFSSLSRMG